MVLVFPPTKTPIALDIEKLTRVPSGAVSQGVLSFVYSTVAVMGCEVNGPQEASHADIGIAGTPSGIVIFVKGKPAGTCSYEEIEDRFLEICRENGYLFKVSN